MNLLAAVTSGRRARHHHARHDWLRVSPAGSRHSRLSGAERADEEAIEARLAQAGFGALTTPYKDVLALPPADGMAQLVKLARPALENSSTCSSTSTRSKTAPPSGRRGGCRSC